MALEPKAALRKSIRATCRALSEATVDSASRAACARALPLVASAKAISVYLAMPKAELSTAPLLTSLFEAGDKRVFVPRVEGGTRFDMRMLHVADASQLESCAQPARTRKCPAGGGGFLRNTTPSLLFSFGLGHPVCLRRRSSCCCEHTTELAPVRSCTSPVEQSR